VSQKCSLVNVYIQYSLNAFQHSLSLRIKHTPESNHSLHLAGHAIAAHGNVLHKVVHPTDKLIMYMDKGMGVDEAPVRVSVSSRRRRRRGHKGGAAK
jgi:hypothetical protein